MADINILDDKTINQIAAGEVVERPVSVVKELVENAIDAGSKNISVEIKDGGISLIRVTDNGSGIDRKNIRTAFLRHATSKIKSVEDLINVSSLGFRGEALSSIASVSMVELLTKTGDSISGLRYCLEGGKEMSLDEVGIPDGTTIIVRNLFFNTPARRKFLKSAGTEGNYVTELMERMILSHPDIGFRYIVNGKEKIHSSGNGDIKEDIYGIFGRDIASLVIPVDYSNENFAVKGFIGKPETARGNRNYEIFYVNNRFVKSQILSKAVEEAYKSYLMLHRYPFTVLYFDIPGDLLDVNVHPAKTEIRFMNEPELVEIIIDLISNGLSRQELIPEVKEDVKQEVTQEVRQATKSDTTGLMSANKAGISSVVSFKPDKYEGLHNATNLLSIFDDEDITPEPFEIKKIAELREKAESRIASNNNVCENVDSVQTSLFEEGFLSEQKVEQHKIIGQIFNTYWIVELDSKMYIIDQHAAHEKVLYERFKKRIDNEDIYTQVLAPAVIVSLSSAEIDILNRFTDNFARLGFEIEPFGGKEYAIKGVPTDLFGLSVKEYFTSVLDDLSSVGKASDVEAINDRIATMACKAAIKGNMSFSFAEAKALIDELLLLDNPYNCPHGRPTIISYSKNEIEKLFKRIV